MPIISPFSRLKEGKKSGGHALPVTKLARRVDERKGVAAKMLSWCASCSRPRRASLTPLPPARQSPPSELATTLCLQKRTSPSWAERQTSRSGLLGPMEISREDERPWAETQTHDVSCIRACFHRVFKFVERAFQGPQKNALAGRHGRPETLASPKVSRRDV